MTSRSAGLRHLCFDDHCRLLLTAIGLMALAACSPNVTTPPSEDALGQQLDTLFERWNRDDSPGAAVVILKDGEPLYRRGFGLQSLQTEVPITPDSSRFDIQSVSKQMTAFAVLLLADRGQLSLDDSPADYLPGFPDLGARISLRQMLGHTSGIREFLDLVNFYQKSGKPEAGNQNTGPRKDRGSLGQQQVLDWFQDQRSLSFDPGSQSIYSNTGYLLLAEVVAQVSGRSFDEFMAQEVFAPLAMKQTGVRTYGVDGARFETRSYGRQAGRWAFLTGRFQAAPVGGLATWGAGGIASTADDLARWLENLRTARLHSQVVAQLLVPASLNDGTVLSYGAGIRVREIRGLRLYSHGGAGEAFKSWSGFLPELGVSIALLGNSYPGVTGLEASLLEVVLDHLGVDPEPVPQTSTEPQKNWVGHYADGVVQVQIELRDEQLFIGSTRSPQGRPIEILADGSFDAGASRLQSVFGPGGEVIAVQFWSGADLYTLEKFEPVDRSSIDLAEAAGLYLSAELGHQVRLEVSGSGLRTQGLPKRVGELEFVPMKKDLFFVTSGRPASLQLLRDGQGRVSGMALNLMRSRGVAYQRQDSLDGT